MKDRLLKYVEMPAWFERKASEIEIDCKRQKRELIKYAQTSRGNNEIKPFLIASGDLNDRTLSMLSYIKTFLQEVANDSQALLDGAKMRDKVTLLENSIDGYIRQRDEALSILK